MSSEVVCLMIPNAVLRAKNKLYENRSKVCLLQLYQVQAAVVGAGETLDHSTMEL